MPELVRLYIRNVAFGLVLSLVFVGALLWFDIAHIGHLVLTSPIGWIAGAMLVLFNAVVFAGVQFGIAVMRMAEPEDDRPGGPRAPTTGALRLAASAASPRHHSRD
jgi:hypothetical protein